MSKFNYYDIVKFKTNDGIKQGEIFAINNYPNETDYDIFVENENCDYKHISEKDIEFIKDNKEKYKARIYFECEDANARYMKKLAKQNLETLLEKKSSVSDYEVYNEGIKSNDISKVKDTLSYIYNKMIYAKCEAFMFSDGLKIDDNFKSKEILINEMYNQYLEIENIKKDKGVENGKV